MSSLPQRFCRYNKRWERLLYRSTALIFGLMIIIQFLMVNEQVRAMLSRVDSMEGVPYHNRECNGPGHDR